MLHTLSLESWWSWIVEWKYWIISFQNLLCFDGIYICLNRPSTNSWYSILIWQWCSWVGSWLYCGLGLVNKVSYFTVRLCCKFENSNFFKKMNKTWFPFNFFCINRSIIFSIILPLFWSGVGAECCSCAGPSSARDQGEGIWCPWDQTLASGPLWGAQTASLASLSFPPENV